MTMIFDRPRAFGQLVAENLQRTRRKLSLNRFWAGLSLGHPVELLMVPKDIRTVDPVLAQEFYHGIYSFDSGQVDVQGRSPFNLPPDWRNANLNWRRELHSFRWLRHLRGANNRVLSAHAQSLFREWYRYCGRPRDNVAWQPDVAARRLMSWLSHSVVIVDKADVALYDEFLRSIGVHIRYLNEVIFDSPDGLPRLQVRLALTYAALCVKFNREPKGANASRPHEELARSLSRQIYADGGHISRCASVLPQILVDLLPLRHCYEWRGLKPPQQLQASIDRMMPAIRFYQHRDGGFARFNGVNSAQRDLISTILRYDDAMGEPVREAGQSCYQRLSGGPTTLLMDVGTPPKGENSICSHAGCLSFEFSSIRTCIVTNCGAPQVQDEDLMMEARSTAAHSTATLNNVSSCRFQKTGLFSLGGEARVIAGPGRVPYERHIQGGYDQVTARHDGYLRQFGVWHERQIRMADDGSEILGMDRFFIHGGAAPVHLKQDQCAIRFHLHPVINAYIDAEQGVIVLEATDNHRWVFSCDQGKVSLEESIYYANPGGPIASSQIVINLELSKQAHVNWRFDQLIGTRIGSANSDAE